MATIGDLIDKARAKTGLNFSQISERLDRSKQLVNNWRSGERIPGDGDVIALARMAGEDMDHWLAVAQAARSDGEAKARWESIAKRLGAAAAMVLCAVGISLGASPKALAHKGFMSTDMQATTEQCLLCKADFGWWARLARWWLAWKLRGSKAVPRSFIACSAV